MSFGNVSSHFSNLKKRFSLPDEEVRNATSEILKKEVGVNVDISKIKVVNSVLKLDVPPSLKNEIFMKKYSILEELKKICKEKTPVDIL